jgi:hypothetical protein
MITCPDTGQPAPTQLTMDAVTFRLISLDGFTIICRACGGEHAWASEDAWMEGERDPAAAAGELNRS